MTRLELVTTILNRLGGRSGATLSNLVVSELQFRQQILEREAELPWFLLEEAAVTVSAEQVTLPTGFLREYEDDSFFIQQTSGLWKQLDKRLPSHVFEDEDLIGSGEPSAYYLLKELHVFPTPDSSYSGRFFHYAAQPALSADGTENEWTVEAPDLLGAEAGYLVAKYLRDFNAAQLFETEIRDARRRIVAANTARKQAAYQAFLGVR